MKINIVYKGKDYNEIEKMASTAYQEAEKFFDKKPESINITVHKSRKDFENKLKRITLEWEVANASYSGDIDILHPDCMAKESTHEKNEFLSILKHEISHVFLDILSGGHKIPKWLNEGFSSFVAGFNISDEYIYIEEKFLKKLGTPRCWDENSNYYAYKISQMFVSFLVKEFSIEKVRELIFTLEKNYFYDNFSKNFEKIFGSNIEIMEKEFVKYINSK